jgi:predicted O-methyltransferase YrrM
MTASTQVRHQVKRLLVFAGKTPVVKRVLRMYVSVGIVDAALASAGTADSLGLIDAAPTELNAAERTFLFAIVRGTKPRRVLEIGTSKGGSALIITTALQANNFGELWSVDPRAEVQLDPELFHGRLHLVAGVSPRAVEELPGAVDGPFDLFFIDGLHSYDQVRQDLAACLLQAADGGYILLHDSFHYGVSEAIREALEAETRLQDAGYVCNDPAPIGDVTTYAGLRLLRVGSAVVDAWPFVASAWQADGRSAPPRDPDLLNHDVWFCSHVQACAYCTKTASAAAR